MTKLTLKNSPHNIILQSSSMTTVLYWVHSMFRKARLRASGLLQCISAFLFQALLQIISPSGRNMDLISSNIFMNQSPLFSGISAF